MNHRRNIRRQIRTKKCWMYFHAAVCMFLFIWFILEVSLTRQTNIANAYQALAMIYSAIHTANLETQIEALEAELIQLGLRNK